jgi:hypothetical protein
MAAMRCYHPDGRRARPAFPIKGVWANLKGQELANHAADTLGDLAQHARQGITRVRRRRPRLLFAFLDLTGLSL